jgi:exopolysaccharide biosynthesis protein
MSDKERIWLTEQHEENGSIFTMNTDYWTNAKTNKHGWFVRNGEELARFSEERLRADLCVIYYDGTMETFVAEDFKADYAAGLNSFQAIANRYPYHVFYFGPELLKDGHVKSSYNNSASIGDPNPRTAFGYYEPGHYGVIMVLGQREVRGVDNKHLLDGSKTGSVGLTIEELAALCESLGMKAAYNMDGGQTSVMMFGDNIFGHNNRMLPDFLSVVEIDG